MVIPTLSIIPQIFTQPTDCQTVPLDSSATDLALKNIQNNLPKAGLITIIFNVDNSPQTDISTIFEMDRTHPEQLTLRFSTLLPVDQDIDNEILMKQTSQAIRKTLTQDIVKSNLEALANYLYERNSNANSKTDDSIPDDSIPL